MDYVHTWIPRITPSNETWTWTYPESQRFQCSFLVMICRGVRIYNRATTLKGTTFEPLGRFEPPTTSLQNTAFSTDARAPRKHREMLWACRQQHWICQLLKHRRPPACRVVFLAWVRSFRRRGRSTIRSLVVGPAVGSAQQAVCHLFQALRHDYTTPDCNCELLLTTALYSIAYPVR